MINVIAFNVTELKVVILCHMKTNLIDVTMALKFILTNASRQNKVQKRELLPQI